MHACLFALGAGGLELEQTATARATGQAGCAEVIVDCRPAAEFGRTTLTGMKRGWRFAHARAWRLVSKKRSMTSAFRSEALRPDNLAAFLFLTAVPVSTAASASPVGRSTRLP